MNYEMFQFNFELNLKRPSQIIIKKPIPQTITGFYPGDLPGQKLRALRAALVDLPAASTQRIAGTGMKL
jgi:hypothetical protein